MHIVETHCDLIKLLLYVGNQTIQYNTVVERRELVVFIVVYNNNTTNNKHIYIVLYTIPEYIYIYDAVVTCGS